MKRGIIIISAMLIIFSGLAFAACTDTDKGETLTALGITSSGRVMAYDRCSNDKIIEAVCENGLVVVLDPQPCPAGHFCSLGRCIADENEPCADTDKGNNPNLFGVVTVGIDTYLIDRCNVQLQLEERFCMGGIPWTQYINCPDGICFSGRCLSQGGVHDGDAVQAQPDIQAQGDWQPLPEAAQPTCNVDSIFWSDGFNHDLGEAGIGLPVYGIVSGQDCDGTLVDLQIINSADGSEVAVDQQEFAYDDSTFSWYVTSQWIPETEGYYYIHATVHEAAPSVDSYDVDSGQLHVVSNCVPNQLPLGIPCGNDPVTGEPLLSGNDFDCDGVDDCADQWVYNYGGDVDPSTGVPVGIGGCLAEWDCTNAPWGSCERNAEGRLTRTRDIQSCFLPEGMSCPIAPSEEKACLQQEDFPVFGWLNVLVVSMLVIGYYFLKRF